MKKRRIVAGLMAASILAVNTTGAMAAGGEKESTASITYKASEEITPPVNPEEPDKPGTPYPEPEPGTKGPLSIDFVSDFNFGEQDITTVDSVYTLYETQQWWDEETYDGNGDPDTDDVATYVQVTDNRGEASGWTLSVEQTTPFTYQDSTDPTDIKYNHQIEGTVITFKNINVNSAVEDTDMWPSYDNKDNDVSIYYDSTNSTAASKIMMGAKKNEGAGTYVAKFGEVNSLVNNAKESVELSVPGKSIKYAGNYETTITWTLSDTPVN